MSCDIEDFLALPDFGANATVSGDCNMVYEDQLKNLALEDLNDEEIRGILFMREEEKLARDVYLNLFEEWGLMVFENISHSEQCHFDAMALILNRYDLPDPAALKDRGQFADSDLQRLYDQLMERGLSAETEALKVGALIEETDIQDIQQAIEQLEGNADVALVYNSLINGSANPLRAFVLNLKVRGVENEPLVLDRERYESIIGE